MITNFTIIQAKTVPSTYSWDRGTPFVTTDTIGTPYTTQNYVSGYAPGVNVVFNNVSQSDPGYPFINYDWDFGDYYNDSNNNVSLTCTNVMEHLYIMPGTYTVTLRHKQSRIRTILETNPYLCRGKFDIRWFWDELLDVKQTRRTWDETACTLLPGVSSNRWKPKWWDNEGSCFEKYCKFWSWYNLKNLPGRANPIIWNDTGSNDEFEKKWMYEANETQCSVNEFQFLDTIEIIEGVAIKIGVVEVKEIPPIAGITCLTRPLTGISPHTVQISPSACRPGSFPIDRIDWDFGDGSPIKTVTRFSSNLTDPELIFTNTFLNDNLDVRNYNVIHTYNRNTNTYGVFYPSLTCYSANTSTSDSCCTTVGPIIFKDSPDIKIIKARNTLKGNVFTFDANQNVVFLTDNPQALVEQIVVPNEPPSPLKDSINFNETYILGDQGYRGEDYPPNYTPSCSSIPVFVGDFLATEDDNPEIPDTNVDVNEPGLSITTEGGFPILR